MVEKMKNQELITNKKPLDLQIKNGIKYFPVFVVLCVFAFLLLAPLVWMCLGSFKSDAEVMQYPPKFFPQANHLIENWKTVMTRIDFLTLTKNTVIYAVGCTIPSMFINALAGYAFARFNFKGKNLLFLLFLATMMIPFQVIMVPLYLEVYYLKWLNTYWGLIIPKVASAYWIFLCRAAFQELPKELEDAARIDGLGEFGIFWKIMLPLVLLSIVWHSLRQLYQCFQCLFFTSLDKNISLPDKFLQELRDNDKNKTTFERGIQDGIFTCIYEKRRRVLPGF